MFGQSLRKNWRRRIHPLRRSMIPVGCGGDSGVRAATALVVALAALAFRPSPVDTDPVQRQANDDIEEFRHAEQQDRKRKKISLSQQRPGELFLFGCTPIAVMQRQHHALSLSLQLLSLS